MAAHDLEQPPVRVLVVEDDPFERSVVCGLVEGFGFDVRSAANGAEAFATAQRFVPSCIVLDLDLGGRPTGLEVLSVLRLQFPGLTAVILTAHRSPYLVQTDPVLPGDCEYLVKSQLHSTQELRRAIERALRREPPIRPAPPAEPNLTRSQAEVLRLLALGASNEEIATIRRTSKRSVELVIQRIYRRLGVDDSSNPRVQATRMYLQSGVAVR